MVGVTPKMDPLLRTVRVRYSTPMVVAYYYSERSKFDGTQKHLLLFVWRIQ